MAWQTRTIVVPPSVLNELCDEGKAVLGPGPRGVTVETSYLGQPLTVKYLITGITRVAGVAGLKLTRRWWE